MFKTINRETSLDTVKTLLAYGFIIEPPVQDFEEGLKKRKSGKICMKSCFDLISLFCFAICLTFENY